MAANASELLEGAALQHPEQIALIQAGSAVTWSALNGRVTAFARGALSRGLRSGDRIAIVTSNRVEFVVAHFGALRAGLVSAPLNPALTAHELAQRTHALSTALVVCDASTEVAVREALVTNHLGTEGVVAVASPAWGDLMRPDHEPAEPGSTDPEALAELLYTAGTSAGPQSAMLTHRALLAAADQAAQLDPPLLAGGDVLLLAQPLTSAHVINGLLPLSATVGAAVVIERRFDADECLDTIGREGVTVVAATAGMIEQWAARDDAAAVLAGLRLLSFGPAPVPSAAAARLHATDSVSLREGYGIVEAASLLTCTSGHPVAPGSVGQPLPGVEVSLRDSDGDEVDEEDPGAVFVRGANLFSGFWPDGAGRPEDDGWYDTGDVAFRDELGELRLVDRRHDLIVVNGFPVYPREVEAVLAAMDGVAEAAVVGVGSAASGQTVQAFVVAEAGHPLTSSAVIEHCALRLARFKCPTAVDIVDELPHDLCGAVLRRDLRA